MYTDWDGWNTLNMKRFWDERIIHQEKGCGAPTYTWTMTWTLRSEKP